MKLTLDVFSETTYNNTMNFLLKMTSTFLGLFLVLAGFSSQGNAGMNMGAGINIPAYIFTAPPSMIAIPGTYAYFTPDADVDVIFFHGLWYRPYEGRWFMARRYNGPWGLIPLSRVSSVLLELPHDFRQVYRDLPRITYRDFNRNWQVREKDERSQAKRDREMHKMHEEKSSGC